ncbi:MAG TPA: proline dehydrogenase family protein [Chthonomonadales bacterium]|nr:proline dehydrogenase family protein [Chthonomonadales bacterium]
MAVRDLMLRMADCRSVERLVRGSPILRPLVQRFIAGDSFDEALPRVRELNRCGMSVALDYLGENARSADEARSAAAAYRGLVSRTAEAGLDAYLSLKLTQLGLDLGDNVAEAHLSDIVAAATDSRLLVRVDMEGSTYTERTLRTYARVRERHPNVGAVIQSYLYRSSGDVRMLNARGASVRLVKGAYREPASVAHQRMRDVRRSFATLAERLLDDGFQPAIATHDERLIEHASRYADRIGSSRDRWEFQMLYGIRRDLQDRLVAEGRRMRIYTPFGTEWYGYFMRRMAERPANTWFVLRHMARR